MADKRYYWIKLRKDFFELDTVDWIMSQPNGCDYIVLYLKMCLLSANRNGHLFAQVGEMMIPFDAQKIARETKFDIDTVLVALELFKKLNMIYEEQDGAIYIPYVEEVVGSESESAERVRKHRENKAALQCNTDVTLQCNTEYRYKSIDNKSKDNKEEDIINNTSAYADEYVNSSSRPNYCPLSKIKELYHEICVSFPTIRDITGKREQAVKARWTSNPDIEIFRQLFTKCENSSFLKGNNNRNWKADFDFMMTAAKFSAILEGKYDDRGEIATNNRPAETKKQTIGTNAELEDLPPYSTTAWMKKEAQTRAKYANL